MTTSIDDLIKKALNRLNEGAISAQKLRELVANIEHAYDVKLAADLRSIIAEMSNENEMTIRSIGQFLGIKTKSLVTLLEEFEKDTSVFEQLRSRKDLVEKLKGILNEVDVRYHHLSKQNRKDLELIKRDLVASAKIATQEVPTRARPPLIRQRSFNEKYDKENRASNVDEKKDHSKRKKRRADASSSSAASSVPVEKEGIQLDYIRYISSDHGKETSRDITIVNGIPFYSSSGQNSGLAGTWFPFEGLLSEPAKDMQGLVIKDGRNIPGYFQKPVVPPFRLFSYMPSEIVDSLKIIHKDLHQRVPCLHHLLFSSLMGGGIWESKEGVKLKQMLVQKYPEFYEHNKNINVSRCVEVIDDYQSQKGLSRDELTRPEHYQNAKFHTINHWLNEHGKVANITPLLKDQPISKTPRQDAQEKSVAKSKPK
ncbi:hypothetical protein [Candidatus Berkiella aquae]|uniref:Uncharacterized protein n=1 Tax=Candidatus Berkiella aquae TaxID=295108 RepID=A0A0Q9YKZ0_9GAMM|nr:hypothetical protein [Candidatus Berkiella aquae]MCS5710927.1 hypothetical protein [Candidatus Berkiella aquae]